MEPCKTTTFTVHLCHVISKQSKSSKQKVQKAKKVHSHSVLLSFLNVYTHYSSNVYTLLTAHQEDKFFLGSGQILRKVIMFCIILSAKNTPRVFAGFIIDFAGTVYQHCVLLKSKLLRVFWTACLLVVVYARS